MRTLFLSLIFYALALTSAYAQTANGRATTSAPTYTDGIPAPLSLDTSGGLRVNCVTGCAGGGGGGTSSDFGDPLPAAGTAAGFVDGSGNMQAALVDAAGNLQVDVAGSLPAGTNNIGDVDVVSTVGLTDTELRASAVDVDVNAALPAGNNNIGNVDLASSIPAGTNNIGDVDIASALPTGSNTIGNVTVGNIGAQATTNHFAIMAASTNSTSVKGSAGILYEISVYNNSETIAYLKLYNASSAPTCGSGTPVAVYLIPGGANGAGSNVPLPMGKTFSTGIGYCVTGGIANSDTSAVAANDFIVNLSYR